jgi:L-asparaginase II
MTARVEVTRGALVESWHRVHVAVSDLGGRLRAHAGSPTLLTYVRSAIKPIQALPLVEGGAAEKFALTDAELALCCASHNGEPWQVEAVADLLDRLGLGEADLACGPQEPFLASTRHALREAGLEPGPLHNNCSGKHAGMLALALGHGWPTEDYHRLRHPVQQRMLQEVSKWAATPEDEIPTAVDGCGVVTFGLRLRDLAAAFARLSAAASRDAGPARIVRAMMEQPEHVGGAERLCTDLPKATGRRIFAKIGAEGVFCAGSPGAELGVAIKIEDGGRRAAEPALLAVLHAIGLVSGAELENLSRFAEPPVRNSRGEAVGGIRARISLETGG